jgi:hypothetical protein
MFRQDFFMIQPLKRLLVLALLPAAPLGGLSAGEGKAWIFEGQITSADPVLAPDLQSGWVLAGSFFFSPMELEEEPVQQQGRSGRLAGGIHDAELTVDLYYQLHFEAFQADGLAGLDYQDDDPDADGRDLFGWFIPMRGRLKDSDWSSRWLQVWLSDPQGRMIRSLPPRFSPHGIEWKSAWFRITFQNGEGESAFVDGYIEVFAPEDQLPSVDGEDRWQGVAIELSELLKQRDLAIGGLRDELSSARDRMNGLQQMVDLMVTERAHLKEENTRLAEQARLADPAVIEKLAGLTAEKVLLEQEISSLRQDSESLETQLAESQLDREQLRLRIEQIEREISESEEVDLVPAPQPPAALPVPGPRIPDPVPETLPAEPPADPAEKPPVAAPAKKSPPPLKPPVEEPENKSERSWRRGPRKFR